MPVCSLFLLFILLISQALGIHRRITEKQTMLMSLLGSFGGNIYHLLQVSNKSMPGTSSLCWLVLDYPTLLSNQKLSAHDSNSLQVYMKHSHRQMDVQFT